MKAPPEAAVPDTAAAAAAVVPDTDTAAADTVDAVAGVVDKRDGLAQRPPQVVPKGCRYAPA